MSSLISLIAFQQIKVVMTTLTFQKQVLTKIFYCTKFSRKKKRKGEPKKVLVKKLQKLVSRTFPSVREKREKRKKSMLLHDVVVLINHRRISFV